MSNVIEQPIEEDMKNSYMDYAMSVIVGRALPDVRDGLKPVHRRILYGMYQLSNFHNKPYKKSARIVGEILGKFHPHGDAAIYDSLVRMAQSFSLRYPLVDGQGNFGCFTKDTRVRLTDGRNLSFGDLIKEYDQGKKNYTFTINGEGNIKIAEIKNPRLTKKNAEIMKVVIDNGDEIKCTLNHKFMLRDGRYKEAQCLKPGDSLMPLYSKVSTKKDRLEREGYEMVYQPSDNDWEYTHHLSDEWNLEHKVYAKSVGRVRHHSDFNKLNNNPDNVQRMHWKDHWILHADHASELHKDPNYRRKISEGRHKFWNNDENRKKNAERLSKRNKKNWQNPKYRSEMKKNLSEINKKYVENNPDVKVEMSKRLTKTLKRLWKNPEYREFMHRKIIRGNKNHTTNKTGKVKFLKICKYLSDHNLIVSEENYENARNKIYPYGRATSWITGLRNYFGGEPELILNELNGNHKVIKVEFLKQYEDVYDITIDKTHNFALAYGVFVHNSIDGDNQAAMRYTEVRMKLISEEMLKDIEKETVGFSPNFDSTLKEPLVLPSKIPNLLVNGSSGIAVGMATNIPPYNINEIADALISLINGEEKSVVISKVKGPDFPTGGIIVGYNGIRQAHATGRGKIRVRARCEIDDDGKAIIVSEIPYQVTKTNIIERIASSVKDGRIEGIRGVHDHSDKEGIRVVIELKKGENPEVVLNQLYKHTPLQSTFGIINLVLVKNEPKLLDLYSLLNEFVEFRKEVVTKRSKFELKQAEERAHILEGLKKAIENIDEIIPLLKKSKDPKDAMNSLMNSYSLSEKQAKAILEMRLSKLISLEQQKLIDEYTELLKIISNLKEILSDVNKVLEIIKEELSEIRSRYGDNRRTEIIEDEDEIELEELIPNEDVVLTISNRGYIKRVDLDEYRSQRRGGKGVIGIETKDGDSIDDILVTRNHNYLLFFTNKGRVYWLKTYRVPEAGRYSTGKAIVNLLNLSDKEESVTAWITVKEFSENEYLTLITKKGTVKRTSIASFSKPRKGGIIAINLRQGDELESALKTNGKESLLIATKNGLAIRFKEDDAREIGRTGMGVIGIRLKGEDQVVSAAVCNKPAILTITKNGYGKRTSVDEYRVQGRGGHGVINIKTEGRNGPVVRAKAVKDGDQIIVVSSKGQTIRIPISNISIIGRNTSGVRIIKLKENEKVANFAVVKSEFLQDG